MNKEYLMPYIHNDIIKRLLFNKRISLKTINKFFELRVTDINNDVYFIGTRCIIREHGKNIFFYSLEKREYLNVTMKNYDVINSYSVFYSVEDLINKLDKRINSPEAISKLAKNLSLKKVYTIYYICSKEIKESINKILEDKDGTIYDIRRKQECSGTIFTKYESLYLMKIEGVVILLFQCIPLIFVNENVCIDLLRDNDRLRDFIMNNTSFIKFNNLSEEERVLRNFLDLYGIDYKIKRDQENKLECSFYHPINNVLYTFTEKVKQYNKCFYQVKNKLLSKLRFNLI